MAWRLGLGCAAVCLALVGVGCGDDRGGPEHDAGTETMDASGEDSGPGGPDAGHDAGHADAGHDAGGRDAGLECRSRDDCPPGETCNLGHCEPEGGDCCTTGFCPRGTFCDDTCTCGAGDCCSLGFCPTPGMTCDFETCGCVPATGCCAGEPCPSP